MSNVLAHEYMGCDMFMIWDTVTGAKSLGSGFEDIKFVFQAWEGMDWLLNGLRIDKESLDTITGDDIKILEIIYKHKQVKSYLSSFSRELPID
jgi:hypothetical protein